MNDYHSLKWSLAPLNMKELSNKSMTNIITTYKTHKIVKGIYIPTQEYPKNWRAFNRNPAPHCNINSTVLNISLYREDGLGAQISYRLWYIAFSLTNPSKYHYYYFPALFFNHKVTNINYDLSELDTFINIGYGERNIFNKSDLCICCNWNILHWNKTEYGWVRKNPSFIFNETVRKYLRNKYFQNKHQLFVYNNNSFNVAIHIRRGDIMIRQENRIISDLYYAQIIKYFFYNITLKNICFYIYSEWNFDIGKFEYLLNKSFQNMYNDNRFKLQYRLNTDLALTYHGLVTANGLVTSKSALSWSAAILSPATYIIHVKGREKSIKQWISCNLNRAVCMKDNKVVLML